ncbi:hypothetical protein Hanom_Chr13g01201481 [Helianthus anomalus]
MYTYKTMGYEVGLGTNTHLTIPGELGFGRGLLGGRFSPGVGWGYPHDMMKPHWPEY